VRHDSAPPCPSPVEPVATPANAVTLVRTVAAVGIGVWALVEASLPLVAAGYAVYWVGDILDGAVRTSVTDAYDAAHLAVADDARLDGRVVGPALVGEGAHVADGALVSGRSVLGRGVEVAEGAHVDGSVVLDGAVIGPHAQLTHCIVGPGARVGAHTRLGEGVVLGECVTLGADNHLAAGVRLSPNVSLPDGAIKS